MPLVKFRMTYGECDEEISVLYEGEIDPGMVRYDPEEVAAIRYDTIAELMERLESGEEEMCSWFEEILRWYAGKPVRMKILEVYAHSHNRLLR
jgi:isopentenyldiphosphate isomerase